MYNGLLIAYLIGNCVIYIYSGCQLISDLIKLGFCVSVLNFY